MEKKSTQTRMAAARIIVLPTHNNAGQRRADQDSQHGNQTQSARPLRQQSYTGTLPCKGEPPLGLHPPFLVCREAHHDSKVAVNRTFKLPTGRSNQPIDLV